MFKVGYNRDMKKKIGYILLGLGVIAIVVMGIMLPKSVNNQADYGVVATNFVGYDLARAVMGDDAEIELLIKPGVEMHDYEPTPEDIKKIAGADLFIYTGGASEWWAEKVLYENGVEYDRKFRLMSEVELEKEGVSLDSTEDEEDIEYDEHVWTSPKNVITLVNQLVRKLSEIYPEKAAVFEENGANYAAKFQAVDEEIQAIVAESSKNTLVFGDKFPFIYLTKEYGLEYLAALPGCAEQVEASAATIAYLTDQVRELGITVILKTEMVSGQIAQTIADETGAKVLELSAAHNVSEEEFETGVRLIDIMRKNVEVLREALK